MSTAFIYNGHDKYEVKDGEKGCYLKYGGMPFWMPYQKVTAIPDFQFREVNHNASTPNPGEYGELTYQAVRVKGNFIADELCNRGIPVPNRDMGIMIIEGKLTGKTIEVISGYDDPEMKGQPAIILYAEVKERAVTPSEADEAERLSAAYKENIIQEYLMSKRQRMNGGQGRQYPDKRTRLYMEEMNVNDMDDVLAHQKPIAGIDPEILKILLEAKSLQAKEVAEFVEQAVEKVRKAGKAQVARGRGRSLGLAENKAKYDAEHAEVKA